MSLKTKILQPILSAIGYYSAKKTIKHRRLLRSLRRTDNRRVAEWSKQILSIDHRILPQANDSCNVTVSLTTLPKRINTKAPFAVYSILRQTHLPNRIVLNLDQSYWKDKELPELIRHLVIAGVEINLCEDVGPHTKLLPSLEKYPDDIIITVDDDIVYEPTMIENMLDTYRKKPANTIIARWAVLMQPQDGKFAPYDDWPLILKGDEPGQYAPLGVAGVLYPPHVFSDEIFNRSVFQKLCPKADDIWFAFMEYREQIPVAMVEINTWDYSHQDCVDKAEDYFQTDNALSLYNCENGGNDKQISALTAYYRTK